MGKGKRPPVDPRSELEKFDDGDWAGLGQAFTEAFTETWGDPSTRTRPYLGEGETVDTPALGEADNAVDPNMGPLARHVLGMTGAEITELL